MDRAISKITINEGHHILPAFEWQDVPKLAVISGVNGSGKTQLLDNIHYQLQGHTRVHYPHVKIEGNIKDDEYNYIQWKQDNLGKFSKSLNADILKTINGMILKWKAKRNYSNDGKPSDLENKLKVQYGRLPKDLDTDVLDTDEFTDNTRILLVSSHDIISNSHLSALFVNYLYKKQRLIIENYNELSGLSLTGQEICKKLNEPPWNLINEIFAKYSFEYEVKPPTSLDDAYEVQFINKRNNDACLYFGQLSSGEQMIVTLLLWAYDEKLGTIKKLLLLDEPDAHLHPSMARMFSEIVKDTLVDKFGVQVILTTHSPATLCWFPDDSIFVMDKDEGIKKVSKQTAIRQLTEGLIFVQEAYRIVLVEAEADKKFHESIYEILTSNRLISTEIKLIFKSVTKESENSGGKSNVRKACEHWSKFVDQHSMDKFIVGLIDHDVSETDNPNDNLFVIDRYCFENYLTDPLAIFTLLVDQKHEGSKTFANQNGYKIGEEYRFKNPSSNLDEIQNLAQRVIDEYIIPLIQTELQTTITDIVNDSTKPEKAKLYQNLVGNDISIYLEKKQTCKYVNGMTIELPLYTYELSGKDILCQAYRSAFNDRGKMNINSMTKQIEKTNLIPVALKEIYEKLATLS